MTPYFCHWYCTKLYTKKYIQKCSSIKFQFKASVSKATFNIFQKEHKLVISNNFPTTFGLSLCIYIYNSVGTKIHAAALWGLVPALEEAGPSLQVLRDWLLPIHAQVQWITLQNVIY